MFDAKLIDMKRHLLKYGQTHIYHFTDRRNIDLIRKGGGLFPRARLSTAYVPGGNPWSIDADNMFGMNRYIHLCFLKKHPMEYLAVKEGRIDTVWLEVSTDVLDMPGILYCAGVSNKSGAEYLNAKQAIATLDFEHMYRYYDFSIPENMEKHNATQKYEILVPGQVPLALIENI